jgi:hypothetical protein
MVWGMRNDDSVMIGVGKAISGNAERENNKSFWEWEVKRK